jgi:hypothetical protein
MSRHEVTTRRVLYAIPGMDAVVVHDDEFIGADGQVLPLRIYEASQPISDPPPVVVIVAGYPDPGFTAKLGCRFMEMAWTISMAQLIAASGMTAITHSNRDPQADAVALMTSLQGSRIGIWATSGHCPVAFHALRYADCAVFSNPIVGEIAAGKPMFLIRSGKAETPGLNAALDALLARGLSENAPITLVNVPDAPHSFDLFHPGPETGRILQQGLDFLKAHLR